MTPLRMDREAAARLRDGSWAVILASGIRPPEAGPILCLELRNGVLVAPDVAEARPVAMPPEARLLALLAPDPVAAGRLAPLLPPGVPGLIGADPGPLLLALLATRLQAETERRLAAESLRDAALRRLGDHPPPVPDLLFEVPPGGSAPARIVQPLGRPVEGLCRIEVHLAAAVAGAASLLRVRLRAGGRVQAAWAVPGPELARGWLGLDLPEPARLGAAEAELELACEMAEGDRIVLSSAAAGEAPLALRVWTSEPGRHVLPRYLDWAVRDAPLPGVPLRVAEADLAGATAEGAALRLVAAGGEPPRLMIELAAGAAASVSLPALPPAPLDLLRAAFAVRAGEARSLGLALRAETPGGAVESGWRAPDAAGAVAIDLPLPGMAPRLRLDIRNGGRLPVVLEVSRLDFLAGAAGETLPPPALPAPRGPAGRPLAVVLPAGSAPPMELAAALPAAAPSSASALAPSGAATWQDVKLQQHMVSPDGGYRHMDLVVTGLVAEAGLWRQVRTKLFDRRGIVGLEFREAKGWPQTFDIWPVGGTDGFGPFWRLETERAAEALAALSTPHDRALVTALLDVLPAVAARGAALAALSKSDAEAWAGRARALASAVAAGRP